MFQARCNPLVRVRLRWLLPVAVVVGLGALTLVPLRAAPAGADGLQVFTPPSTIADDCSTDVANALRNWLYSLPTGTPTAPVVVSFAPGGCYLVNESLYLRNFRNTTFEGNGATFRQVTPTQVILSVGPAIVYPYCASPTFTNDEGTVKYFGVTDIMWWFEGGCDITVKDMNLQGPASIVLRENGAPTGGTFTITYNGLTTAPIAYNASASSIQSAIIALPGVTNVTVSGGPINSAQVVISQYSKARLTTNSAGLTGGTNPHVGVYNNVYDMNSAIQLSGTERVVIQHMFINDPDGDFVTIAGLHEVKPTQGGQAAYPSTDITVTKCWCTNSGRQGVSVTTGGDRVAITNSFFSHVDLTMFDLENDTAGGCECDVLIANNLVSGGLAYLVSAQTGASISNFAFIGNNLVNGAQMKIQIRPAPSWNITIANNTASMRTTWLFPSIGIDYGVHGDGPSPVDNVKVANNNVPVNIFRNTGGFPFVYAGYMATNVAVRNNTLPGVDTLANNGPLHNNGGSSNYSCGNTATAGGVAVDGYCVGSYTAPSLPQPPLLPATFPTTSIVLPSDGASLAGTQILDATAFDYVGVTNVEFHLSGGTLNDVVVGSATPTWYGWLAWWDTTAVANGAYTLQSVAYDAAGNSSRSSGIAINVTN